ncbi:ABC transporter permease [Tsukamurella soli]|uniref:ABC transporter permease n=1 Tax=Tsukamurella soli TaxID=644556 RepID=A0ABP8JPA9_9ACTN
MAGLAWLSRRVAGAALTLLLASIVIFGVLHVIPGDPAAALAGPDASPATLAALRHQLGVDRPLVEQYLSWLGGAATGHLGRSYVIGGEIGTLLREGSVNTLALGVTALVIAIAASAALALLAVGASPAAAPARERWPARCLHAAVGAFEVVGIAVPPFVTGVILVELFAVVWPVLPAGGTPPGGYLAAPGISLQYLLLPAVCLAMPAAATLTRFFSEALRTEWAMPYVLTARAAGVPTHRILVRGAARNALPATVTVLGIQTGQLLGSAVLVEAIFAWPGLGQLLAQGIGARDYPVVQATLLVAVAVFIGVQLLTDAATAALDPTRRGG